MDTLFRNWKTLGLVLAFLLVVILLFQGQIAKLLEGAEKVSVGPSGVEIVGTPVGKINKTVNKTAPPRESTANEGQKCNTTRTYCDPGYGFLISVPNAYWTIGIELPPERQPLYAIPESADVPVYMTKSYQSYSIGVAVGILLQSDTPPDIQTWVNDYTNDIQSLVPGTEVMTPGGIDAQSNSAIVVTEFPQGKVLVSKNVLYEGRAYKISTSALDLTSLTDQDRQDLTYILDSFVFLV